MTDTPVSAAPADDTQVVFSIYDGDTGAVRVRGTCPASMANIQPRASHEGMIFETLDPDTQYVDVSTEDHVSKSRPRLGGFDKLAIKADNTDVATLVMPIAGKAFIDGDAYDLQPGAFALKVDHPGTYDVLIQAFPYRDFTAIVTAIS